MKSLHTSGRSGQCYAQVSSLDVQISILCSRFHIPVFLLLTSGKFEVGLLVFACAYQGVIWPRGGDLFC